MRRRRRRLAPASTSSLAAQTPLPPTIMLQMRWRKRRRIACSPSMAARFSPQVTTANQGLNTFTLLTTINNRRLHRRSPTLRKIHDDYSAATASTTTFDFDLRVTSASKRTSGDAIPLQADCGPVNMQHRCLECGAKWNSHNLLHAHLRDNFDQDSEDFKKGPREDWRLSFQKRGCKHSLY